MNNVFGICKGCGKDKLLKNKTFSLCDDCNQLRLHGKDRFTRRIEKIKSRQVKVKLKKIKPRKTTGEAKLFKEIWFEREHICHNCGIFLGNEMKTFFFMHIKAKGAHPGLRLTKENISLACYDCHTAYDRISIKAYKLRKGLYSNK